MNYVVFFTYSFTDKCGFETFYDRKDAEDYGQELIDSDEVKRVSIVELGNPVWERYYIDGKLVDADGQEVEK